MNEQKVAAAKTNINKQRRQLRTGTELVPMFLSAASLVLQSSENLRQANMRDARGDKRDLGIQTGSGQNLSAFINSVSRRRLPVKQPLHMRTPASCWVCTVFRRIHILP
jgi:hypothetical protein